MSEMLARWRFLQSNGITPDVHEFCHDYPDLEASFRRLIETPTAWSHGAETTFAEPKPATGDQPLLAPPQGPDELGRLGDFRLLRLVGRGGMGMVYEGEDIHLHRRVAIKVLLPTLADEKFRERFMREARAVAALNDDRIVTVYQVGKQGEMPFMVMEFLEGETLEERLGKEPITPLPEAVRIAREVAEGLAAAHAKEMIHRDVKPANIWVHRDDGHIKLLDFGLARPQTGVNQLTAAGTVSGTIGYMAPEQIYAGPMDGRTDLYALGCVFYRMLTGSLPHEATNTIAILEAVVKHEPAHLETVAKDLPAPVADLLRRLLARNPDDRPKSAAAVAEELTAIEHALAGRVKPTMLATVPHRPKYPFWKIAVGAGTVLLACVIGLATQYNRLFRGKADGGPGAVAPAGVVADATNPVRIGVLHSRTGGNRDSERPMIEAITMAVDEMNEAGGVLGRKVEMVVRDTRSDDDACAALADELIDVEKVTVLFGGWSSAGRKLIADVCAKRGNLLVYSCLGEGLEEHPNVVYVGGAPNQQLREAANWSATQLRRRKAFLVGSEYDLYSHAAHEILKDEFKALGIEVVGARSLRPTGDDFREMAAAIKTSGADIVFNTLDGPANIAFFRAMRQAKINARDVPTVWLGVGEDELGSLELEKAVGDVCVSPYFKTISSKENKDFVQRFQRRFPARQTISDGTAVSYNAVYLWKQAVEKAQAVDPAAVREAFKGQSRVGPEGETRIDPTNLYAWRRPRLGRMSEKREFEVIHGTEELVAPQPFPGSRSRADWEAFLNGLYLKWGGRWNGPKDDSGPETTK
jgi:urea transport system substrate-binding protein